MIRHSLIHIFLINLLHKALVNTVQIASNDEIPTLNRTRIKRQTGSPQTCVPLSALNGQVNYLQTNPSTPYSSGTTAILACNFGFIVNGSPNSICGNSIWSPPLGTCNSAQLGGFPDGIGPPPLGGILQTPGNPGANCFPQIPPINGQLRYSAGGLFGPFSTGTTVSLTCNPGFLPTGGTISTCELGIWQPPSLGFCNTSGGVGGSGFSVNGVTTSGGTSTNSIANSFSTSPSSFGAGSGPQCLTFPRPVNGQIQYSLIQMGSGYPVGTIATLICDPGFMTSQISSICGASGLWNPLIGTCSPLNDMGVNSVARRNNGLMSLLSMGSGQCLLGMLPPLGSTINYSQATGTLGPFPSGTMAILTCLHGNPIGPRTSSCDAGQWDPPLFQGCDMSQTNVLHTPSDIDSSTPPVDPSPDYLVSAAAIVPPTETTTSISKYSADDISTPALEVSHGGLKDAAISTQFIGGSGISSPCLLSMPPVAGGTILYSQGGPLGPYPTGSIATLQCNSGSSLGLLSSSCLNGVWSTSVLGPCTNSGDGGAGSSLAGLSTLTGIGTSPFGVLPLGSPLGATPPFGTSNPFNTVPPFSTSALPGSIGNSNLGAGGLPNGFGFGSTPGGLGFGTSSNAPGTGTIFGSYGGGGLPGSLSSGGLPGSLTAGSPSIVGASPSAVNPFGTTTLFGSNIPIGSAGSPFGIAGSSQPQCLLGAIPPLNGQITYIPAASQLALPAPTSLGPYTQGTIAQLVCNQGFTPRGQQTAVCQSGLFEPPLGQCISSAGASPSGGGGISFSGPQNTVPNQSFSVKSNNAGSTTNNDVLEELSESAHEQSGCPNIELATTEGGRVTYVLDGNKTELAFADISNSNSVVASTPRSDVVPHPIGTVATLSCNAGYVALGSMVTICEIHGWSMPVLGDCIQPKIRSLVSTVLPHFADNEEKSGFPQDAQ